MRATRPRSGASAAGAFAEVSSDVLGTPLARVAAKHGAGESPRRLLVMGHIDEIGLIVTHIDDEGYLWFAPVGGWDAQILVGQRVALATREGVVGASSARSRSTCCARRTARRSPRSASCTSTSAPLTASRRASTCASATSP